MMRTAGLRRGGLAASLLLAIGATAMAAATSPPPPPPPGIAAAVADPGRPAEDTARDAERRPADMLAFAGVKPGMVVVDLFPGGGYFSRLFSAAVGPGGKVIAFAPDEMVAAHPKMFDRITAMAAEPGRGNVVAAHRPLMAAVPAGVADIVWTAQNYHDLHDMAGVDVAAFNRLVFAALKPGGAYVILDHAAAPGSGLASTADLHRIDPAIVRREVEAAGFRFAGESRVLANPADPHTAKVFDPAIRGHTDQFVYRFRKPG